MKMIKVTCQGKAQDQCDKAYKGCKDQIMYSKTDHKIICEGGKLTVTDSEGESS